MPLTARLYNPKGTDRVAEAAVVSALPVGRSALRVLRGPTAANLKAVDSEGPFPQGESAERFRRTLDRLWSEGFHPAGLHALLGALKDARPAVRGRAALRIGRLVHRIGADTAAGRFAVDALSAALPGSVDDACSILDALGEAGDRRAIPALRTYAERKLLSRRRSAVEALRQLEDAEGLAAAAQRGLDRLPASVKAIVESFPKDPPAAQQAAAQQAEVDALVAALRELEGSSLGSALDTLYESASPPAVAAVATLMRELAFDRPGLWRAVKSVFKRSLLRFDSAMFGLLTREFEVRARTTTGRNATVKSGYDGVERQTRLFGRATQRFVRRAAWRHLRRLARWRPDEYPAAATEVLVRHGPQDAVEPDGLHGRFSSCWSLSRILFGGGDRFVFDARSVRSRFRNAAAAKAEPTPASPREEAFPELWDRRPELHLRVLGECALPEAHVFAVRALSGPHRGVLQAAPVEAIVAMVAAPCEPTVLLALNELERRFDADNPDWALITRVVHDEREAVRGIGRRWLGLTARHWVRRSERATAFLTGADPEVRAVAADLLIKHLPVEPDARRALAAAFRARLSTPETSPGEHEGIARVCREALSAELAALFGFAELMGLVAAGSASAQAVAGDLLDRRGETLDTVAWEKVALLAGHSVAAVRKAAVGIVRRSPARLRVDPSALFALGESEWPEVRSAAAEMFATVIDPASLGAQGRFGLLDSNRAELQAAGRELTLRMLPTMDGAALAELVDRLIEHSAPRMRNFALELMTEKAPAAVPGLEKLRGFCRKVLLDVWPSRKAKRRVLGLVISRGLTSPAEAVAAVAILQEVLRLQCADDFERALEGLVRLRLAFPAIANPVALAPTVAPVEPPAPKHRAPKDPASKDSAPKHPKGGPAC